MGKGDIKTKKGKIAKGSYGVRRPRPKSSDNVAAKKSKTEKPKTKVEKPKKTKEKKSADTK